MGTMSFSSTASRYHVESCLCKKMYVSRVLDNSLDLPRNIKPFKGRGLYRFPNENKEQNKKTKQTKKQTNK